MIKSIARIVSALLVGAAALAASAASAEAKRVALVVGNDAYQALTPLQKAVNDARSVKAALEELGFSVIAGENLTRREMNVRLSDLDRMIEPGDQVFLFYAGHGVAIGLPHRSERGEGPAPDIYNEISACTGCLPILGQAPCS